MDDVPEDLLAQILARLPVVSLAQVRSVCRKWNRIVTSHSHAVTGPQHAHPWLFGCRWMRFEEGGPCRIVLRAFDPVSSRWFSFPLPTAGKNYALSTMCGGPGRFSGLVLLREPFSTYVDGVVRQCAGIHYWVGNPLLQRWEHVAFDRKLFRRGASYVNQLAVDESTNTFKILHFEHGRFKKLSCEQWTVHIYNSSERRWTRGATTWLAAASDYRMEGVASSKDTVYLPFISTKGGHIRVVGYVVEQNRFEVMFSGIPRGPNRWTTESLLLDDRRPEPAPALLEGPMTLYEIEDAKVDVTTFAQDQDTGSWSHGVHEAQLLLRIPRSRPPPCLVHTGNLSRLYVGTISRSNYPDGFMMYERSEWRQVPQDPYPYGILNTSEFHFKFGTFVPRFDVGVNSSNPEMNVQASSDHCSICSQLIPRRRSRRARIRDLGASIQEASSSRTPRPSS